MHPAFNATVQERSISQSTLRKKIALLKQIRFFRPSIFKRTVRCTQFVPPVNPFCLETCGMIPSHHHLGNMGEAANRVHGGTPKSNRAFRGATKFS
jgi:hypothetical protein